MEEHLPLDSPIGAVYRVGGALVGLILLAFAVLGLFAGAEFITIEGEEILGLGTNGLLSLLSAALGLVLIGGAFVGGNVAATTNTTVGIILLVCGLVSLGLLRTDANFLAFRMTNVIFCFVIGTAVLTFGLYGRVSSGDPEREQNLSSS